MNERNACRHTRSSTSHGYCDILARFGLGIYRQLSRSDDEDADQLVKDNHASDNRAAKLLGTLGSSAKSLLAKAGSAPSNNSKAIAYATTSAACQASNGQQQDLACALSSSNPAEISACHPNCSTSSTIPAENYAQLKAASGDADRHGESRHPRFSVDGVSISSMGSWGSLLANEHHAPAESSSCNESCNGSGQQLVIPRISQNDGNRQHNSVVGRLVQRQSQHATPSILEQNVFVQSMICEDAVSPMLQKLPSSKTRPAQEDHMLCISDAIDSSNEKSGADDSQMIYSPAAAVNPSLASSLAEHKRFLSNGVMGSDMVASPVAEGNPAVLEMQMQVTLESGPSTWATPFAVLAHIPENGLQQPQLSLLTTTANSYNKSNNSGRPAMVPRLNLSALAFMPDEDGYDTDGGIQLELPNFDKCDESSCDSEEELEQELLAWAKTPTWLPCYEGRKYVYGPMTHQEVREYEQLIASLPPSQAAACQRIWSQMAEARYACELMASRGTRIVKDVTHEWSQMSSNLIQRIEAEQASAVEMHTYCAQQNLLIQQLTHQLRFAHAFKREPAHLPHSASQPTMHQAPPLTESVYRQPRRAERGGPSREQMPLTQSSPRISAPVLLGIPEFSVPPYLAQNIHSTGLVTTASEPYFPGGLNMHQGLMNFKDSLSTPGTSVTHLQGSSHDMQNGSSASAEPETRLEQAMIHQLVAENQRLNNLNNHLQQQMQVKAGLENENYLLKLQISRLLGVA